MIKLSIRKLFIFTTIFFLGLVAGLLYAYSVSVNPGLKLLPDREYLVAMQSINKAIQNPLFFISFIGLLFVFPVTIYQFPDKQTTAFYLLLVSMLLYFIGVFGLTVFGNVPLNNRLAKFSLDSATAIAITEMRRAFEKPWNTFHTIRTIAATASFSLGILSLLLRKS